jgi:hypothetical protein
VRLLLDNAAHAKYGHWVRKMIVWSIVHASPCVHGGVIVPWAQLIDDDLTLNHHCLEEQLRWEVGRGGMAHGNDDILCVTNGALGGVLSMDAWSYQFIFDLGFAQEGL